LPFFAALREQSFFDCRGFSNKKELKSLGNFKKKNFAFIGFTST